MLFIAEKCIWIMSERAYAWLQESQANCWSDYINWPSPPYGSWRVLWAMPLESAKSWFRSWTLHSWCRQILAKEEKTSLFEVLELYWWQARLSKKKKIPIVCVRFCWLQADVNPLFVGFCCFFFHYNRKKLPCSTLLATYVAIAIILVGNDAYMY